MKLAEVRRILEADVASASFDGSLEAEAGCGADLISDVLAFAHSGALLLTGLTNPQVVVAAETIGLVGIVFVRGKLPAPETVLQAEARGVALLATHYTLFEACGRLFAAGLVGCDRRKPPPRRPPTMFA